MCAHEFVFRVCVFCSFSCAVAYDCYGFVKFAEFAEVFEVVIHFLVRDDRQCQAVREFLVFIFVEDGLCECVEVNWKAVVCLLGGYIVVVVYLDKL